ncbi:hypothetical protein V5799_005132, partial [Amblyomma americanum]
MFTMFCGNITTANILCLLYLQLSASLEFDEFVAPVCLPESRWGTAGERLFVAGWGATNEKGDGPSSDVLQYTTLEEAPHEMCEPCLADDYNESLLICSYSNSTRPQP